MEFARHPVDSVGFHLAGIVGNVEQKVQTCPGQNIREGLSYQMADDLAIGEGAIDAGPHGAEIAFAERRQNWGAGQLAIRQVDADFRVLDHHFAQEFGADLVAQPARSAMDGDDDIALRETEGPPCFFVEQPGHFLDFEVMIAGTQRPHLLALAKFCALRNAIGASAFHSAMFLDPVQVVFPSVSLVDGPDRTALQHRVHFLLRQPDSPRASQPRGHRGE